MQRYGVIKVSEIGQTLKNARVDKGLTLDDLQQTTKIQKRYLIAIEEENFDALPGDFYVKAFIREYAETVDLDADELLASIDSELDQPKEEPTETSETVSRMNLREKNKETEMTSGQKFLNYLPTIVIVVVVVAIIGTVFGVSYNNKRQAQKSVDNDVEVSSDASSSQKSSEQSSQKTTKKKTDSKQTSKKKKSKSSLSLTQNSGSNFTYDLKNAPKTNKVSMKVSGGDAWNAISIDGSQSWQGTLGDGENHSVDVPKGASSVSIQLGNSKATSIKVNGKKFNFLKDNSDLTVRTITIQLKSDSDSSDSGEGQTSQDQTDQGNDTTQNQGQESTQQDTSTSQNNQNTANTTTANSGVNQ